MPADRFCFALILRKTPCPATFLAAASGCVFHRNRKTSFTLSRPFPSPS
ncbi:hypothetical protein CLOSTMETH_01452 [[Clostridium] methylpentosum DSM 5476]|uniref:Uncharacterized protein n=1 Tax=[Clostridium] methylpentosum DSM 5476 TaxID=537013 RepID=C0EC83_9FIRM|nr:hypothetical protein CLOSTMETH_01452 [[Clostridium] methylpentosum DSM 5476]